MGGGLLRGREGEDRTYGCEDKDGEYGGPYAAVYRDQDEAVDRSSGAVMGEGP